MCGNEKGTATETKRYAKWKKMFITFQRVKNLVTLFLKQQLARLMYSSSVTMVSYLSIAQIT
jgi:hypothetical protein